MPSKKSPSKRAKLAELLSRLGCTEVTEAEWTQFQTELAPVSDSYLRQMIRKAGLPLAPILDGVHMSTLADLDGSLSALLGVYLQAGAAGDRERANACRALVIAAKDRARWSARRAAADPVAYAHWREAERWALVWLESPESFPVWSRLRLKTLATETRSTPPESHRPPDSR